MEEALHERAIKSILIVQKSRQFWIAVAIDQCELSITQFCSGTGTSACSARSFSIHAFAYLSGSALNSLRWSIGHNNRAVMRFSQPRQDLVAPGFLTLMSWCAFTAGSPFSVHGRYLCGISMTIEFLMVFVSDCLACDATDCT